MSKTKPFSISKWTVWEAYKRVKANKGAAGVDDQSIEDFEGDLKNNLYRIWNRMSSGTYFPPPVRRVVIPKKDGRERYLGIPTVSDRTAQMVVKMYLEPKVEPHFHPDSYGYRPKKSAIDAVGMARERCFRYAWVLDLDIKGLFDNIDHDLMMRAVRKYTDCKWVLLYIERWLKAPAQTEDGALISRDKGTPQGGVASPLLANIFMHLSFDSWMQEKYPAVPFERYADDTVVHCQTEAEAIAFKSAIERRLRQCKLELHPEKTKIVFCKNANREGSYPHENFDFLGYSFRPRLTRSRVGEHFVGFNPAVSAEAAKKMRETMRSWRIHRRTYSSLEDIASDVNPVLQGWINYYGRFYKSALVPVLRHFETYLVRWVTRKYKRFRGHRRQARHWLGRVARRQPSLFAHWRFGPKSAVGS